MLKEERFIEELKIRYSIVGKPFIAVYTLDSATHIVGYVTVNTINTIEFPSREEADKYYIEEAEKLRL